MLAELEKFIKKNERQTFFIIIIFAFFVRLVAIQQSFWLDEAINVLAASQRGLVDLIFNYSLGDFHPPLYHAILWTWFQTFPVTELTGRFPSIIFGLLTITLTYKIGLQLFHKQSKLYSLLTAFLIAFSGLHIYYSQEARMYSLAAFATSLVIFHTIKLKEKNNSKNKILFLTSLIIMLFSDYQPWLLLPMFLFIYPGLTALGILATFGWWPTMIKQINQGLSTAISSPAWGDLVGKLTFKQIALVPIKFLIGRVSVQSDLLYIVVIFIPIIITIILLVKAFLTKKQNARIIQGWLLVPLISAIAVSRYVPLFSYFRFLFSLPAFYLLLVLGISKTPTKYKKFSITMIISTTIISTSVYLFNNSFHREDWKSLSSYIQNNNNQNSLIIFPNKAQSAGIEYYTKGKYKIQDLPSIDLEKKPEKIIYIKYVSEIFDPKGSIVDTLKKNEYEKINEKVFRGILIWEYEPV